MLYDDIIYAYVPNSPANVVLTVCFGMISPRICELVDSMKDFARRLATAEEEIVQVGVFFN